MAVGRSFPYSGQRVFFRPLVAEASRGAMDLALAAALPPLARSPRLAGLGARLTAAEDGYEFIDVVKIKHGCFSR